MGKFKKKFMNRIQKLFEPIYGVERYTIEDGYASDTIIVMVPRHENADTEDDFYKFMISMPEFGEEEQQEKESIIQMSVIAVDYIEPDNDNEFLSALNYVNHMTFFGNFAMNPMDRSLVCKYSQFLSDKDKEEGNLSRVESTFALLMTEMLHFSGVLSKIANKTMTLEEVIGSSGI